MDNVRETMKEIGAKNGIAIEFDEAGACALPLADDRYLQLQVRADAGEIDFVATLGAVPDEARPEVFEKLLAANYYWKETLGATLAWQTHLEQVVLSYPLPIATTDAATLETAFANFLKLQEEWAKRLRADVAEARGNAAANPSDATGEGAPSAAAGMMIFG